MGVHVQEKHYSRELVVINDDASDMDFLRQLIKSSDFLYHSIRLLEFNSCKEAAKAMHFHQANCYLISYRQPSEEIFDFIKSLRRRKIYENIPVIILADKSQSDISIMLEMLRSGVQDFLIREELTALNFLRSIEVAVHQSEFQKELYEKAHYDQLTGLLSRHLFTDRLQNTLNYCDRFDQGCSLLYIDVDNFKVVNDCYGHDAGDVLLQTIAQRIKKNCRATDSAARLGGDEFAILISGVSKEKSQSTAEKILEKASEPIEIDSYTLHVSLSIGIAHYPDTANNIDELLEQADQAMYRAKKSGKARYFQFSQRQQLQKERQERLETLLPEALNDGAFEVEYQAIQAGVRGALKGIGVEVKWSPGRYKVDVKQFHEMIERMDLSEQYNEWLINYSLTALANFQKRYSVCDLPLRLCLNGVVTASIVNYLNNCLKINRLQASQIEIEISEAQLMKNLSINEKSFSMFKQIGIDVSIGHFHGQHSSLDNLTALPLHCIKIHPDFFSDIEGDSQKQKTIEAIAQLGKVLDIKIIASGINSKSQYLMAKNLGCDFMQGEYISQSETMLNKFKRFAKPTPSAYELAQ
jgi:diguanylate cyclase (GGDEF)-like protein